MKINIVLVLSILVAQTFIFLHIVIQIRKQHLSDGIQSASPF